MEATKDSDRGVDSSLGKDVGESVAKSSRPGHSVKEGEGGGETSTSSSSTTNDSVEIARLQNEITDLRNECRHHFTDFEQDLDNTKQNVHHLRQTVHNMKKHLHNVQHFLWANEKNNILQNSLKQVGNDLHYSEFTGDMWDSLEHLLSEQGINLPRKHIKEHLLLTERKQLSTKFDELSRDYKTLALITVADLILNKRESKWRAGLLKSMESKGIILETNDARNSINRILSKVKKYLIGSGISDTDVSSLNTLLNVNLNRIDYVRLARAFKLEGAENLALEEEEQDETEPRGIGLLPDETTSDNTLLVVNAIAPPAAGDDNVSMMTSETTEQAKQQSKKRLTSATSLTSSATTTSLSTHTSAASLSTKSSSSLEAVAESKMASTFLNDATDSSLEDKHPTGSLNIESTQLLDVDISKSRQQQQELREDEGQSKASMSMLVSIPEKQIPKEQSDIQRQTTVKKTTVPEPLSVLESRLREKQSNVQKLNEMIDKATEEMDIRLAKLRLKRTQKELEDIKLKCRLHPDAVNNENAPTAKSKSTQMSLSELKDEVKKIQTTLRTCHDFQKRQSLIKKENHLLILIRKKKNKGNHRKPLGARN